MFMCMFIVKNYTDFFEINILNWYNIFISKDLKSTIFVEVWNKKMH